MQFIVYTRSEKDLVEVLKTIKTIALVTIDNFTVKFHNSFTDYLYIGIFSIIKYYFPVAF